MIYWIFLIIAGFLEIVWAYFLQKSNGNFFNLYFVLYLIAMGFSIYTTAIANRGIPMFIIYPILIGIGAIGTYLVGIFIFEYNIKIIQLFFIIFILIGICGLRFF